MMRAVVFTAFDNPFPHWAAVVHDKRPAARTALLANVYGAFHEPLIASGGFGSSGRGCDMYAHSGHRLQKFNHFHMKFNSSILVFEQSRLLV